MRKISAPDTETQPQNSNREKRHGLDGGKDESVEAAGSSDLKADEVMIGEPALAGGSNQKIAFGLARL